MPASKLCLAALLLASLSVAQQATSPAGLSQVHRIYVGPLTGNATAEALRDLIIAGIDGTKLFVLTDNPDRADAVLKGAADDSTFTDTFDTNNSVSGRTGGGKYTSSRSVLQAGGGVNGNLSDSENESHHIRERKHEAYASVRLCNKDGDILWSTTQESPGAKFHGASSDVATKIAHQLALDTERARETSSTPPVK